MRRRWNLRVKSADDRDVMLVVDAGRDGEVRIWTGASAMRLAPEDVAKLRRICADALAVALQDRGHW